MTRYFTVKSVHKQMYPATYNFKDDTDDAEPTGWTTNNDATTTTTIIAVLDGHRKVLQLYDNNGAGKYDIEIDFSSAQTSGTVELWFHTTDNTLDHILQLLQADDTIAIQVDLNAIAGVGDDTTYHYRITFDCTPDTYDHYLDGTSIASGVAFTNAVTNIITIKFIGTDADSGYYNYVDAIGFSWDSDYNIGDNVHWRHFKESTDDFESDDVGTQGTSITWVDSVDTAASVEIIPQFDEHKKVLRQDYTSAVGGYDESVHNYATQEKDGWFSFWIKVTNAAAGDNRLVLYDDATFITIFRIASGAFYKYTAGAFSVITGTPAAVNNTWYHIFLKWVDAATDTVTCWIDNVEYETYNAQANQTSGINKVNIQAWVNGDYIYIDAPMSSLDSDVRADNRTFEYNDTYTKTDITSTVINVPDYHNKIYGWRTATLISNTYYEASEIFFEIYDVNTVLAMNAEIKNRILDNNRYLYPLRDMLWDDLHEPLTHTFTTDAIHDPTDSTSLLKTALPNVSHIDGDLILANADTESTTYSPVLKNYPTHSFLRDISDIADSVTIIEPNGRVTLDADLASGDTLDVDTAAHKAKMTKAPVPNDILETINYFEIMGAINPDTGERFYKIIDNSGSDKKRRWRNVPNNSLHSQTDVDAYATALSNRIGSIKIIRFDIQDLGVHNMGETLNYKYVRGKINIPQANYYIIEESIDFDKNLATIVLSEGLIEESKYAASFERPEEYTNSYAAEIYETDINTVYPYIHLLGTAAFGTGGGGGGIGYIINADNEGIWLSFYLDEKIDDTRDVVITITYARDDANNDAFDYWFVLTQIICDGSAVINTITAAFETFPACVQGRAEKYQYTIPTADTDSDYQYAVSLYRNAAGGGDARNITITNASVKYYMKRSV